MSLEVITPEEFAGSIMDNLSSRRGQIEDMGHHGGSQVIHATAPLAEMFGYATRVQSISCGRAGYDMRFARYQEAPDRGEPGGDQAGVTANRPRHPKGGIGFASAQMDEASDQNQSGSV